MPVKRLIEFYEDKETGCFVVTSHSSGTDGRPVITKNYETMQVARHIYEECFGFIPPRLVVRHRCDNPCCINPAHLELGTQWQNMEDWKKCKRRPKWQGIGKRMEYEDRQKETLKRFYDKLDAKIEAIKRQIEEKKES